MSLLRRDGNLSRSVPTNTSGAKRLNLGFLRPSPAVCSPEQTTSSITLPLIHNGSCRPSGFCCFQRLPTHISDKNLIPRIHLWFEGEKRWTPPWWQRSSTYTALIMHAPNPSPWSANKYKTRAVLHPYPLDSLPASRREGAVAHSGGHSTWQPARPARSVFHPNHVPLATAPGACPSVGFGTAFPARAAPSPGRSPAQPAPPRLLGSAASRQGWRQQSS